MNYLIGNTMKKFLLSLILSKEERRFIFFATNTYNLENRRLKMGEKIIAKGERIRDLFLFDDDYRGIY
jgi:hypothetical protein